MQDPVDYKQSLTRVFMLTQDTIDCLILGFSTCAGRKLQARTMEIGMWCHLRRVFRRRWFAVSADSPTIISDIVADS